MKRKEESKGLFENVLLEHNLCKICSDQDEDLVKEMLEKYIYEEHSEKMKLSCDKSFSVEHNPTSYKEEMVKICSRTVNAQRVYKRSYSGKPQGVFAIRTKALFYECTHLPATKFLIVFRFTKETMCGFDFDGNKQVWKRLTIFPTHDEVKNVFTEVTIEIRAESEDAIGKSGINFFIGNERLIAHKKIWKEEPQKLYELIGMHEYEEIKKFLDKEILGPRNSRIQKYTSADKQGIILAPGFPEAPEKNEQCSLHEAFSSNSLECFEVLISYFSSSSCLMQRHFNGLTILQKIVKSDTNEEVKISFFDALLQQFKKQRVHFDHPSEKQGATMLHHICWKGKEPDVNFLNHLVQERNDYGFNLTKLCQNTTKKGQTPFLYAAMCYSRRGMLKYLCEHIYRESGDNFDILKSLLIKKDYRSNDAIYYIILNENDEAFKWLHEKLKAHQEEKKLWGIIYTRLKTGTYQKGYCINATCEKDLKCHYRVIGNPNDKFEKSGERERAKHTSSEDETITDTDGNCVRRKNLVASIKSFNNDYINLYLRLLDAS